MPGVVGRRSPGGAAALRRSARAACEPVGGAHVLARHVLAGLAARRHVAERGQVAQRGLELVGGDRAAGSRRGRRCRPSRPTSAARSRAVRSVSGRSGRRRTGSSSCGRCQRELDERSMRRLSSAGRRAACRPGGGGGASRSPRPGPAGVSSATALGGASRGLCRPPSAAAVAASCPSSTCWRAATSHAAIADRGGRRVAAAIPSGERSMRAIASSHAPKPRRGGPRLARALEPAGGPRVHLGAKSGRLGRSSSRTTAPAPGAGGRPIGRSRGPRRGRRRSVRVSAQASQAFLSFSMTRCRRVPAFDSLPPMTRAISAFDSPPENFRATRSRSCGSSVASAARTVSRRSARSACSSAGSAAASSGSASSAARRLRRRSSSSAALRAMPNSHASARAAARP